MFFILVTMKTLASSPFAFPPVARRWRQHYAMTTRLSLRTNRLHVYPWLPPLKLTANFKQQNNNPNSRNHTETSPPGPERFGYCGRWPERIAAPTRSVPVILQLQQVRQWQQPRACSSRAALPVHAGMSSIGSGSARIIPGAEETRARTALLFSTYGTQFCSPSLPLSPPWPVTTEWALCSPPPWISHPPLPPSPPPLSLC